MAEKIAPFMSYADWNELGPIGRALPKDDEIYDGTTREQINEPNWARLKMGGPNKILGNPDHDYQADAFTSAHAQAFHISSVLKKGGKDALRLVREAAKQGDAVTQEALRIGGHKDAWTMVGPDAGSAQALRALVSTSLEFYPPAKGVKSQQLPKELTPAMCQEISERFEKNLNLKRLRNRSVERGKISMTADKGTHRGAIAVYCDTGLEGDASRYIDGLNRNLIVAVGPSMPLWQQLIADEKSAKDRDPKAQVNYRAKFYKNQEKDTKQIDDVLARSDAAVVFLNGDPKSKGYRFAAAAARAGKLARAYDENGQMLDVHEVAYDAKMSHMSKKEFVRNRTLSAFELPANEPAGRFALGLIRGKDKAIAEDDVMKLAMTGEPINLLCDMAGTEEGARSLNRDHKVSAAALEMLRDEKGMANAREKFIRINRQLSDNGVAIVGSEDFPSNLQKSTNAPTVLFAQGNVDLLRNSKALVGVIGEGVEDKTSAAHRITVSRAAPAVSALASSDATLVRTEHCNSVQVPVRGPQVLVIGSGHGHVSTDEARNDRQDVLDAGGLVLSMLPPEETSSFYNPETKQRESVPATGNEATTRAAAQLMAKMSDTVLVTEMDASKTTSPTHAVVKALLENDRRPVAIDHSDLKGMPEVSGSRALLATGAGEMTGAKALRRAGFGNDVIETIGKDLGDSQLAMNLGHKPEVAVANLVKVIGGEEVELPKAPERSASRGREIS